MAFTSFTLSSTAFQNKGKIPTKYTCEGEDLSPELHWENLPQGCKSLALIVDDPDAPDPAAPKMTYVHWVLYNIPSTVQSLSEGIQSQALPMGTVVGQNDWGRHDWGGPCPPIGEHRYFFKLYALDTLIPKLNPGSKKQLEELMKNHIIGKTELVGVYQKSK